MRASSVLHRIGVSYGVIALIVVFVPTIKSNNTYFKDIIEY